jgi:hypothetical protein
MEASRREWNDISQARWISAKQFYPLEMRKCYYFTHFGGQIKIKI